jgi:hypothetical protein
VKQKLIGSGFRVQGSGFRVRRLKIFGIKHQAFSEIELGKISPCRADRKLIINIEDRFQVSGSGC